MAAQSPSASAPIAFQFQEFPIRVIVKDGDPWFIASEVCSALDMTVEGTRRLDSDEKGLTKIQTLGGEQEITIISEPGLYRLIGRSNKSAAKRFNRWVCHEVLPSIRKTGGYQYQPIPPQSPSLLNRRWVVSFQGGREIAQEIDWDDRILKFEELPRLLTSTATTVSSDLLADIAKACIERLQSKTQGMSDTIRRLHTEHNVTHSFGKAVKS